MNTGACSSKWRATDRALLPRQASLVCSRCDVNANCASFWSTIATVHTDVVRQQLISDDERDHIARRTNYGMARLEANAPAPCASGEQRCATRTVVGSLLSRGVGHRDG